MNGTGCNDFLILQNRRQTFRFLLRVHANTATRGGTALLCSLCPLGVAEKYPASPARVSERLKSAPIEPSR